MNFDYFHKQINKIIEDNDKITINTEIDYNELKLISIKIFNIYFNDLKMFEKKFNINIIKKLYNESNFNLKIKILIHTPDFYTILLNDFLKFTFQIVQKTKQNVCSKIYNYCYKDGEKIERLPEYKYHLYLTHKKEDCVLFWFNEYKKILNYHLNDNFNHDIYIRQSNIIIKLTEIKTEIEQNKYIEKSINNIENSINYLENNINYINLSFKYK